MQRLRRCCPRRFRRTQGGSPTFHSEVFRDFVSDNHDERRSTRSRRNFLEGSKHHISVERGSSSVVAHVRAGVLLT